MVDNIEYFYTNFYGGIFAYAHANRKKHPQNKIIQNKIKSTDTK